MQKKAFDFKKELETFLFNNSLSKTEFVVSDLISQIKKIIETHAESKFNFICMDKDFPRFASIVNIFKEKEIPFSAITVESAENTVSSKKIYNYDGNVVIAVGDYQFLQISSYYASLKNVEFFGALTTPTVEYLFSDYIMFSDSCLKTPKLENYHQTVIIDYDLISKAPQATFGECYISTISKLLSLIEYKLSVLLSLKEYNQVAYKEIKRTIMLVAGATNYQEPKAVILYASIVCGVLTALTGICEDSSVELFANALSVYYKNISYGDRYAFSFFKLSEIFALFFSNDMRNFLTAPDYYKDIQRFENVPNLNSKILIQNLKMPTERRKFLISEILSKTSANFLNETSSVLCVIKTFEKNYKFFVKDYSNKKFIGGGVTNALILAPYLSNNTNILTLMRDFGVINLLNFKK